VINISYIIIIIIVIANIWIVYDFFFFKQLSVDFMITSDSIAGSTINSNIVTLVLYNSCVILCSGNACLYSNNNIILSCLDLMANYKRRPPDRQLNIMLY